jgi:hypothetical protein
MKLSIWVFALAVLMSATAFAAMPTELVLYYSFDDGTVNGDTVTDLSDYGNDGLAIGDPGLVDGQIGEAMEFGGSQTVEIVTSESLAQTAGQITMEAWVNIAVDGTAEIISRWDNTGNGITHFEARAGGNMRFCMRNEADSSFVDFTTSAGGLDVDTWVHVAEVYDGSDAIVYYDGEEIQSAAGSDAMRQNENVKLWIGSMYGTDRWFNGMIDEIRIWSKALSQDEIKMSMDGTLVSSAVGADGKLAAKWAEMK